MLRPRRCHVAPLLHEGKTFRLAVADLHQAIDLEAAGPVVQTPHPAACHLGLVPRGAPRGQKRKRRSVSVNVANTSASVVRRSQARSRITGMLI